MKGSKHLASIFALALIASSASGCFRLRDDLTAQKAETARLRTELEKAISEESSAIRRNTADQGLQLEGVEGRLAELEGRIAEVNNAVDQLEHRNAEQRREIEEQRTQADQQRQQMMARIDEAARAAGLDVPVKPEEVPKDKKEHFRAARQALQVTEHSYSRALFREFVKRYPDDRLADDAQYWLGVSYLRQGQPAAALGEFRRVIKNYRQGDMLDATLLDMAEAFVQVRACKDAQTALTALIENHKKSPLVKDAQKRLREVKRFGSDKCD